MSGVAFSSDETRSPFPSGWVTSVAVSLPGSGGLGSVREGAILGSPGGVSPAEQASAGLVPHGVGQATPRNACAPRHEAAASPCPARRTALCGHGEPVPDVPELATALARAAQGPFAVLPSGGPGETRSSAQTLPAPVSPSLLVSHGLSLSFPDSTEEARPWLLLRSPCISITQVPSPSLQRDQ